MPDEYSYNDFVKMQQQAIDRVRQMQKKATDVEPQKAAKSQPTETKQPKQNDTPRQNQNPKPQPPKQETKQQFKPPIQHEPTHNMQKKQSPFAFLSNMDSDMSLILPLLLLLGKEGADNILLLALLYIIS